MSIPIFPKSADEILATLVELFDYQDNHELAAALSGAQAYVEYAYSDDYNDGVEYFRLRLELPVRDFAPLEPRLEILEKLIESKLKRSIGNINGNILQGASIAAMPSVPRHMAGHAITRQKDVPDLWGTGLFRLFLSHISKYKADVMKLKEHLRPYGISAFVAHEDIEPSLDWQKEIVAALESMTAMAALLTPDFHSSNWTDQEVGIAQGRGVLVIPVQLGTLPYGFLAKQQALRGDFTEIPSIAAGIVDALTRHPQTSVKMLEALVLSFEHARSFAESRTTSLKIETSKGFTPDQLDRMKRACENNRQVKESTGVVRRIERYLTRVRPPKPPVTEPHDDEIPF